MPRIGKKRQAEIAAERARYEERIRAALRWTAAPERDVPPPAPGTSGLTAGYTINAHARIAVRACSSSFGHGYNRTDRTDTQGSLALYSSRRLALQALRAALEREFAEALEKIDRQIEQEEAGR